MAVITKRDLHVRRNVLMVGYWSAGNSDTELILMQLPVTSSVQCLMRVPLYVRYRDPIHLTRVEFMALKHRFRQ